MRVSQRLRGAYCRRKDGVITIEGVEALHGCRHEVIPDRIETATYMAAAAVTGGTLLLRSARPEHVNTVFPAFEEAGCQVSVWKDEILISAPSRLRRVKTIRTMPYPGFPTDAQAPLMAMACLADGTSVFIETIFENRYKHAGELMRLGAKIKVEGRVAVVEGVPMLSGRAGGVHRSAGRRGPGGGGPRRRGPHRNHLPDPFGQRLRGAGGLPGADRGGYPAGIMMVIARYRRAGRGKA